MDHRKNIRPFIFFQVFVQFPSNGCRESTGWRDNFTLICAIMFCKGGKGTRGTRFFGGGLRHNMAQTTSKLIGEIDLGRVEAEDDQLHTADRANNARSFISKGQVNLAGTFRAACQRTLKHKNSSLTLQEK